MQRRRSRRGALPGLNQWRQLREPADHGIGRDLVEGRHVVVREQDGAHAKALRAMDVVPRPVTDEDTPARVGDADGGHRGAERLWMRFGPVDLAGVDGAVEQVQHIVAAEHVLVPATRPHRVGQYAGPDARAAQVAEQPGYLGVGQGMRFPRSEVAGQQALGWHHSGLPDWPAYSAETRATMIFNAPCEVRND